MLLLPWVLYGCSELGRQNGELQCRNVSHRLKTETQERKSAAENLKYIDNDNGSCYGCTFCLSGRWWGIGKARRLQKHIWLLTGEIVDLL